MKEEIRKKYEEWLNNKFINDNDKEILKNMSEKEIEESFYKKLEFGTAGIRGIMGLGSSKINEYTIGLVTVGLANYLNKKYENPSVVIAYDTRNNSKEYAQKTALILNHYNIKTYIFDEVTSTPELSFSVKYLNCTSGIVITSSHNEKIYNGYKVYNSLGGQIIPPEDTEIINEIDNVSSFESIKYAPLNNELYNVLNSDVHEAFLNENEKVINNIDLINNFSNEIKLTYSSLHGVGLKPVIEILEKYNINYNIVKEQSSYDGNFPFAPKPNPEIIENYDLAVKYAKENNSDIIILTDPDADRIGVMVRNNNEYKLLTGNEIDIIFTYFIINEKELNENKYVVRSLPSTNMIDSIANKYNIKVKEVLTGCKNIAKVKNEDEENYLFGFEESLGYMFNINVNDKNSFSSLIKLIEIICYCKNKNITLIEYLNNIYNEIGYYNNLSESIVFEGIDSNEKINKIMSDLRNKIISFENVNEVIDYSLLNNDLNTNALKYIFNDNSKFIIRPSGTEPKIKIYFEVIGEKDKLDEFKSYILNKINAK